MIDFEHFMSDSRSVGRPAEDRAALAHASVARATLNLPATEALIERLKAEQPLCRWCEFFTGHRIPPKPRTCLERQQGLSLDQMIMELPTECDVGTKRDSQGFKHRWYDYKLHIDTVLGDTLAVIHGASCR